MDSNTPMYSCENSWLLSGDSMEIQFAEFFEALLEVSSLERVNKFSCLFHKYAKIKSVSFEGLI